MRSFIVYSKYKGYNLYVEKGPIDVAWIETTLVEMRRKVEYQEPDLKFNFDNLQFDSFEKLITSTLGECGIKEDRIFSKWGDKQETENLLSAVKEQRDQIIRGQTGI